MEVKPPLNTLAHYGVKGMKWGIRKRDRSPVEVATSQTPGKKVKATGGKNLEAHEDAIRARTYKQKARKSTTDSLSNKELQELITRMNLEQQFDRLDPDKGKVGRIFARKMVETGAADVALAGIAPFAPGLTVGGAAAVGAVKLTKAYGENVVGAKAPGAGGKKKKK